MSANETYQAASGFRPFGFDKFDAPQMAQTTRLAERVFVRLFGAYVNRYACRIILRAKERSVINSPAMHELLMMFDPTQHGLTGLLSGKK